MTDSEFLWAEYDRHIGLLRKAILADDEQMQQACAETASQYFLAANIADGNYGISELVFNQSREVI